MTSPPSDEELMERFMDGDPTAFDTLFERFSGLLHRYLLRASGSSSAADDLLQTTFLSVVRSRGRFRRGSPVRPWLYAIATNAARDWRRKGKPEQLTETGELPEEAAPESVEVRDLGALRQVREALNRLPEGQREAIVMHGFEGLSFPEIADALNLTVVAVRVRAHRGYQMLRKLLAPLKEES